MSKKPVALAALSGILYGVQGFFILNLINLGSVEMNFFSNFFAVIFLSMFILAFHQEIKVKSWKTLITLGILSSFVVVLYTQAILGGVSLGDASFLLYSGYIFSIPLSWFLLKDKANRLGIFLLLIVLFGAGLILKPFSTFPTTAALLALASGIAFGLSLVFRRKNQQIHNSYTTTLWNCIITATVLLFVSLLINFKVPTTINLFYLLAYGLISTALPILLLTSSLKHLKTFEAGVPQLVSPVIAIAVGFLVFGQVLDIYSIAGGVIILIAIFYMYKTKN
jgi:drug/metabolite transporter (DMT)-like permease